MNMSSSTTWQPALAIGGGLGTLLWAIHKHKKGKFWYFMGGAAVGAVAGYMLDKA